MKLNIPFLVLATVCFILTTITFVIISGADVFFPNGPTTASDVLSEIAGVWLISGVIALLLSVIIGNYMEKP